MSWDDEAASWDDEPAVRQYAGAAWQSLKRFLDATSTPLSGARILDFGCGTGLLTSALANEAESRDGEPEIRSKSWL